MCVYVTALVVKVVGVKLLVHLLAKSRAPSDVGDFWEALGVQPYWDSIGVAGGGLVADREVERWGLRFSFAARASR